jgi:hypothetical protein
VLLLLIIICVENKAGCFVFAWIVSFRSLTIAYLDNKVVNANSFLIQTVQHYIDLQFDYKDMKLYGYILADNKQYEICAIDVWQHIKHRVFARLEPKGCRLKAVFSLLTMKVSAVSRPDRKILLLRYYFFNEFEFVFLNFVSLCYAGILNLCFCF